jgi:hypothetical protein
MIVAVHAQSNLSWPHLQGWSCTAACEAPRQPWQAVFHGDHRWTLLLLLMMMLLLLEDHLHLLLMLLLMLLLLENHLLLLLLLLLLLPVVLPAKSPPATSFLAAAAAAAAAAVIPLHVHSLLQLPAVHLAAAAGASDVHLPTPKAMCA